MASSQAEDIPRPDWLDQSIFPFPNRRVDILGHTVHYIDEGQGPTLLMLHGNGSWSYGFRHVIPELSNKFRVVALDYPGFGLSKAAPKYSFKPVEQSAVVEAFVDALGLNSIRLFVEDWGGPIGLGLAGRKPDLFHSIIISNTWAWPAQGTPSMERFSKFAGGPIGSFLTTRFNFLQRYMVPMGAIQRTMSHAEKQAYYMPYPTTESRIPQTIFPYEILGSREYLSEVELSLGKLKKKPVLVIWGEKDPGFTIYERSRWLDIFPHASLLNLPNAKHYVAVDEPEKTTAAILDFEQTS